MLTEEDRKWAARELLESQEKARELEDDELVIISCLLKDSESENMNLKKELMLSKERHQESVEKHEELCLEHERMLEQISKTEARHNLELNSMQDALQAHEWNNEELKDVKEAFDSLSVYLKTSSKDVEDLKLNLQISIDEAGRFEKLHRQSSLLAASETKKALELGRLLELAKSSAVEMQNQMVILQDELKILYENIAKNQKQEEMLKRTTVELSNVCKELEFSQSKVHDLKCMLAAKEALISKLTQELELATVAEFKAKEGISSMKSLQEEVSHLENVNSKLKEKERYTEELEAQLKSYKAKMKIMQDELAKSNIEKVELKDAVTDQSCNITQIKEFYDDLEAMLQQSDENFHKAYSLFSQAMTKSRELEQIPKVLEVVTIQEKGFAEEDLDELTQRMASEGQELHSQISDVLEESNLLYLYESSKKDLYTVGKHLKEQLREQKANETLCTQGNQKSEATPRASSTNAPIRGTEISEITTLKFIFVVVLLSVVLGVILGRKY